MAKSGKRIVITGATGAIGRQLVERLTARGDHVIAFVRDIERARRSVPAAAELVHWSSRVEDGEWRSKIDGADAIVNLAGSPIAVRWSEERKKEMRESRVRGTEMIVLAIEGAAVKPKVLINASAVGYYGAHADHPCSEQTPSGSDFLATLCADWERAALKAEGSEARVVLVRTGIVLDPNDGALAKLLPPFKLFVGGRIGSGKQPFPWIHVEDEIQILLWALDNDDVRGPINAAAPETVNNDLFSRTLARVLHRPVLFPVPPFALTLVFGEGSIILTGGQKVIPKRTEELGYRFKYPELEPALRSLTE